MSTTNQTLIAEVNSLIEEENRQMNSNFTAVAQEFGAEVDESGTVVEGGMRGFRTITFTTDLDSEGTEENESQLDNRELFKSAWKEVAEFKKKQIIGEAIVFARRQSLREEEMQLVREGMAADTEEEKRAINDQISELRALNKGCLADITDASIHRYFVERELEDHSPELMGHEFEASGFNRLMDEVAKERIPFLAPEKLDKNWIHLVRMKELRQARFEWLKVKVRESFDECQRLRKLGYSAIYREKVAELNALKNRIIQERDYSFSQRLLDSLVPEVKNKPLYQKRNFYLKTDLRKKVQASGKEFNPEKHLNPRDQQVVKIYQESRGLTFEQSNTLLDGFDKMLNILKK